MKTAKQILIDGLQIKKLYLNNLPQTCHTNMQNPEMMDIAVRKTLLNIVNDVSNGTNSFCPSCNQKKPNDEM